MHREIETDVGIIGGGVGGFAAALAVARSGRRCVVTEPTDWIGGQFTSQGVPADENRWIEYEHGVPAATGAYLHFRDAIRQWYRDHRPLTDAARANVKLNPGNGWVGPLCAEPRIAHAVMLETLAPLVARGLLTVLLEHQPTSADVDGNRVRAVTVSKANGDQVTIRAAYFLDATELGDLLPLTGAGHHVGAEAISEYGELHGHPTGDPNDQQSISWCFALEHRPGEDHTIARPERYDFWRDFMPQLSPPWPGRMLSWTVAGHDGAPPKHFKWKPWPQQPEPGELEMWRYRRIVDRANFTDPVAHPDVALMNVPQMDYFLAPILDASEPAKRQALWDARQQSLSLVYWLQTESPRFDGTDGVGFPGLRLRGDELGTTDGFAKAPYIREARRLDAQFVVHEGHVGTEQRRQEGRPDQDASPYGMGEPFADSVGIGHYRLDLHPSTGGRNTVFAQATPFRIPLGALLPKRLVNLIAAGKCLGVTHVTNGAYRLHPIEWNVGEAAGALAAFCLDRGERPTDVRSSPRRLREFQRELRRHEMPLSWPWERDAGLA